jgi:crotonobetaine/carnitine-CoA ligase
MAHRSQPLELSPPEMVISRLFERRAETEPDRAFLHLPATSLTYGALDARSGALAGWLAASGIGRGDRVGLMLPNGEPFLTVYVALGKLGAIVVPINPAYRGYLLEYVLADTACSVLFADATVTDALRPTLATLPAPPRLVVVGADVGTLAPGEVDYATVHDAPPVRTRPDVTFTDVNCVIYTSGTTGPSKGVPLTNAHGVHKAYEVNRVCQMSSDDVIYSPLPLFHSMALLRGVLAAVVSGGECVLRDRFSASQYWDDVRRHGATIGHCVFTIPQILKKAPPSPRDRDHTLRCLYQGRYDAEFEERFGVRLIEGYGLTEAGVATYVRADEPPRPGSCGRVSDEWEVQLVDDDDLPVPAGAVGEIVLRPRLPWLVTPGYLNKPEATAATFRNLWFHTGDLAVVDDDGYYYFKDRKKDSMRRRGENVSSWELEQVVRELAGVDEAAATPFPSPVGEDEIRVFVTLLPDEALAPEAVVEHCERRLPGFMVPRYVEIVDALPRTPTGRIQKFELRSRPLGQGHHDAGERGQRARSDERDPAGRTP